MISTITYLEQNSPDDLTPARIPAEPVEIRQAEEPSPEFHRFLYTAVGGDWHWTGKLPWDWDQWMTWLNRPAVETWVAWVRGTPAGYASLAGRPGTEVEIENFGLLPAFIGRGIGGHLLTVALQQAWVLPERQDDLGPVKRVWLHTNTLDGPHALANYRARGLRVYRTTTEERTDADVQPPGPWPGANRTARS